MRLRLLQDRLPDEDAAEVSAAVLELRGTLDELRRIANGIRPSQLDDGLAAALTAVKEVTPLPFSLDVAELPEVGEARAMTAYLVISEAVANVLKHAQASSIAVTVGTRQDRLSVEITDDGVGGLPADAPLPALRDRVLSVGGSLDVRSAPGAGTTITAVI
jgi:signal transduction histidine kinase